MTVIDVRPAVTDARAAQPFRAGHPARSRAAGRTRSQFAVGHPVQSPLPLAESTAPSRTPTPRAAAVVAPAPAARVSASSPPRTSTRWPCPSGKRSIANPTMADCSMHSSAANLLTEYQATRVRRRAAARAGARELPRPGPDRRRRHGRGVPRRTPPAPHAGGDQGAAPLARPEPAGARAASSRKRARSGGLKHPNIVAAIDAGEEPPAGPDSPAIPYFVMELVPGHGPGSDGGRGAAARSASPATSPTRSPTP